MTRISGDLIAIDIETISLNDDPDFEDTSDWELLAVGVGYQPDPRGHIESEVLFREGGWDTKYTADLLQRVRDWCKDKNATVVTYNGNRFDKIHLQNWSKQAAKRTNRGPLHIQYDILFHKHVDLKPIANEKCEDWPDWQRHASYEKVCKWEGINVPEMRYDEFGIEDLINNLGINSPVVKGKHIGAKLGERYIQHNIQGTTDTEEFRKLRELIRGYTESDIIPLIRLARELSEK